MAEGQFSYSTQQVNCEANINEYIFNLLLSRHAFVHLVIVQKVKTQTGNQPPLLDVLPLVTGFAADGSQVENEAVFNVPAWRLQRGASAVIMDPVEGDIGLLLCCDRDITKVKKEKKESLPASRRTHSRADGIYLGGVLNADPVQYVKFASDGIDIVSPLLVSVTAPNIELNGSAKISLNAPVIEANGQLTQGSGSFAGNATFGGNVTATGEVTGNGVKLSTHVHGGVESGNSTTQGPQ